MDQVWKHAFRRLEDETRSKYEFIRELGRGGMGAVLLARDLQLDRLVAIKVLSPAWLAEDRIVERFLRESRTVARLRHPSIVTVHGAGRAGDLHYFVMDFIEGVTLSTLLWIRGRLPIEVAEAILFQVGSALHYAHQPGRSVVHRDVKPSNIMLDADGHAVVTDFGIARLTEDPGGLTRTGIILGTPEFMSPEQCLGQVATPVSDQYSLGTVAYAMLVGRPPFSGPSYQVMGAHVKAPAPPIRQDRPDCPPGLAAAVERMLEKAPDRRWPDIGAALAEMGLRPAARDDPTRREITGMVSAAIQRTSSAEDQADTATPGAPRGLSQRGGSVRTYVLEPGDRLEMDPRQLFADDPPDEAEDLTWESADSAVVRVDQGTGQLVAVGAGTSDVRVRAGKAVRSVPVVVRAPSRAPAVPPRKRRRAVAWAVPVALVAAALPLWVVLDRMATPDSGAFDADPAATTGGGPVEDAATDAGRTPATEAATPPPATSPPAEGDAPGGQDIDAASPEPAVASGEADAATVNGAGSGGLAGGAPEGVESQSGVLELRIYPWAFVFVDGVQHGEYTDKLELSLPPGLHRLRLERPPAAPVDTTFVITAGAATRLLMDMRRPEG